MALSQRFGLKIERSIDKTCLRWPTRDEAAHDSGLGGNREYSDMRRASWRTAKDLFAKEDLLIARLEAASDTEEEYDQIVEELYEDDEGLFGLDIGVASAVLALSAVGCTPCSSCNGGAYGGQHYEEHPLVAFFAKPAQVDLLIQCAEEAHVGLENGGSDTIVVYADHIDDMRAFARALYDHRAAFRVARQTSDPQSRQLTPQQPEQPFLPFGEAGTKRS